jgi:tetratricopeptide (TPR) repeat protein
MLANAGVILGDQLNEQSWHNIFVGREKEMQLLLDAWHKAKANKPQFVMFLAETGIGKTRLVQHLYGWMNKNEDPHNYWPDTLENDGTSLTVNATFPEGWEQSEIPWLWWGLRATDPTSRNPQESIGSAIHEAIPKLLPHVEPIVLKRHKNDLTKSSVLDAVKSIANLASLGGLEVVFTLADLGKKYQEYQEEKDRQEKEKLTISQISDQKKADASEQVFGYLKTILDRSDKDATSIPIVLVLDDAQWLDEATLKIVERLWQEAYKRQWPLLIIATHWLREWRQYETRKNIAEVNQPPHNLVHLIRRNAIMFIDWKPHVLPTMPGNVLQPVLISALPGLSQKQQRIILERVGGNPQFLDDLIRWIQESPRRFFTNQDCTQRLTELGEKAVSSQLKKGHMALIRERFSALDENMRDLLGFASYQGIRFIEPLILEVVQLVNREDDIDWKACIDNAIHPYAVVNRISNSVVEFRQHNIFYVAQEHFDEGDVDRFRVKLLQVLRQWFESDHIAGKLITDREALLLLLANEIEGAPEDAELLVSVQMGLVNLYRDSYRSSDAARFALQIVEMMPESGWASRLLPFDQQTYLATALSEFSCNLEAMQLYGCLIIQIQKSLAKGEQIPSAWKICLAVTYINRGNLFSNLNQFSEALEDYNESIRIQSELCDALDEQYVLTWQNGLATATMNRGNLHQRLKQFNEALEDYSEAIRIRNDLHDELSEQFLPEWQNELAAVHLNRGTLFQELNRSSEALEDYSKSIRIRSDLRNVLGEQFMPAWQNELAAVHMNQGSLHQHLNRSSEALEDYNEAIRIRNNLRDAQGEQSPPAWKNDLASTHMNRGLLFGELNRSSEALEDYNEAICIRNNLRDILGEQFLPEWQNELATVHLNRGNLYQRLNNRSSEALEDYNEAIRIRNNLRDELGEQFLPEWQNKLATAHMNRGNLYQRLNNRSSEALEDYNEAIRIRNNLRGAQGEQSPPAWKNDLASTHMNRGILFQKLNRSSEALEDYSEAIRILNDLRDELGEQFLPEWQKDLATAYINRGIEFQRPNRSSEALEGYNEAIRILNDLRDELGEQFLPEWKNYLAVAHISRGNLFQHLNRSSEVVEEDYNKAICILNNLRDELGEQFLPEAQNHLAMVYYNFGQFLISSDEKVMAGQHFMQAHQLGLKLHQSFGDQMPDLWSQLFHASRQQCLQLGLLDDDDK